MRTKEVDEYIEKSADFAKVVLNHLRDLIHQACPEAEEKLKWGFPHFDYKGVYVGMAAFKQHCAFNFWKAQLMADPDGLFTEKEDRAMGHFGRIHSLDDLPKDEILIKYLLEAKRLNDLGIKRSANKPTEQKKSELITPDDLLEALKLNPKALEVFDKFPYSHKKDYINWINEAKTDVTRKKRIETTVEWSAEGKGRNWRYQ